MVLISDDKGKNESVTKSSFKKLNSYSSNSTCSNNSYYGNEYNSNLSNQNCPYCTRIRKLNEKIKNKECNSLAEFKEKESLCGVNCPRNGYFSYWVADNQSCVLSKSSFNEWKSYKKKKLKSKNTIKSF